MATQKEMREMREAMVTSLQEIVFAEFEQVGVVVEGVLLQHKATGAYMVLKPIAKKETFDAEDALAEYEEKVAKAIEREAEKAEKAKKKEKKAE
jgi:hypothetical protein